MEINNEIVSGGGAITETVDAAANKSNKPHQPQQPEALFRQQVFEQDPGIWSVAAPIVVRNLAIPKDDNKHGDGLPGAPNFMTAIVGRWLSAKLGCMNMPESSSPHKELPNSNKVISNVSAVFNPGEATLLIAPSSSGKSTLMRTIANLCQGNQSSKTEGTLLVGGCDPADPRYSGCFRRSTAFADQGDLTLTPVLTVEETLRFSSDCAIVGTNDELEQHVSAFLRLAGLVHVAGTVVGNAEIRGVSGGQKVGICFVANDDSVSSQLTLLLLAPSKSNGTGSRI